MSMWRAADAGISKLSAGEATGDCMISAGDISEVRTKHRKARRRRLIARHLACGDLFRAAGQAGKCVTVERIFPRAVENLSMQIGRQSKLSGGLREAQQEVVVKVLRSGGLEEPRRGRSVGRIYFVGATRRRNPSSWVAPVGGEKAYFSCNSGGATPSWRGGISEEAPMFVPCLFTTLARALTLERGASRRSCGRAVQSCQPLGK